MMANNRSNREYPLEVKIGQNIAEARLRRGFDSLSQVAKISGVPEDSLRSIEQGDIERHLDKIYALICLYGCSTHEIFEGYFKSSEAPQAQASDISECADYVTDVIGLHKKMSGRSSRLEVLPLKRGSRSKGSFQNEKTHYTKVSSVAKRLPLSTLERRADAFMDKHSLHKLPVNVYQAAYDLGVRVSFEEFPSKFYMKLKGFCYREKDFSLIGLNKNHPAVLQRFTLAHELHHYLYDFNVDKYLCGPSNEDSSLEWNAESFAAELLMPRKFLNKLVNTPLNIRYLTIHLVAEHFGVSYEAAAIRLARFRLISDAKVACTSSYRKKDKEKTNFLLSKHEKHLLAVFGLETGIKKLLLDNQEKARHLCGAHIHDKSHTICWQCGLEVEPQSNDYLKNPFRQSSVNTSSGSVLPFREKSDDYKQLSFNLSP
jgi:Zn-dependent peptidase ImmA (M78 family)